MKLKNLGRIFIIGMRPPIVNKFVVYLISLVILGPDCPHR